MDEGLVIGYDFCKDFCRISYLDPRTGEPADHVFSDEQNPYIVQNSICRKKGSETWLIGEAAYETALFGDGYVVDKLLKLVSMDGFATFEGRRYSAEDLLTNFLRVSLKSLFDSQGTNRVAALFFSVQELSRELLDTIMRCAKRLGLERKRVHIISHTESFLFFVLSQKRELWSNLSVLYDLSGDGLNYYEMEILRGMRPNVAYARRTFLEEGFSVDILENPSGYRMADNIMTQSVERMLNRKLISSAYLSGNGMDNVQAWGPNFLKTLCSRRKVFFIENLFARGAVLAAADSLRETSAYPFSVMCEGRISVDITVEVCRNLNKVTLPLARVGGNWYESRADFDIIPDGEDTLVLKVRKLGERRPAEIGIPLNDIANRGNKKTRFGVSLAFTREDAFRVQVRDKGFGEFFPSTDAVVEKVFTVG